jgi:hypothetical protein
VEAQRPGEAEQGAIAITRRIGIQMVIENETRGALSPDQGADLVGTAGALRDELDGEAELLELAGDDQRNALFAPAGLIGIEWVLGRWLPRRDELSGKRQLGLEGNRTQERSVPSFGHR